MPEDEFSMTRIFAYKDKIEESILRENTGQKTLTLAYFMQCKVVK